MYGITSLLFFNSKEVLNTEQDIQALIGKAALLEQLAEEASELAHAALKYARIIRGDNPTPVTEEDAKNNLIEEYTDVVHCARELSLVISEAQIVVKDERWCKRIKEASVRQIENCKS